MIKLIVDNLAQVTILEELLAEARIPCEICKADTDYGIATPYLIVNGAPLDFERSIKWIEEHSK